MKIQVILALGSVVLLPTTLLSQPPVPPNPNAAPSPPAPPLPPGQHESKVPVTYLGVETSEVPAVLCDQLGLAKGFGLVVDYVVPDGPAASAGVQQNDVIKMLNDQILTDPGQLAKLVRSYSEGTTITLTLLRKGQEQKVSVKLEKKEVPRRHALLRNMPGVNGWDFDLRDMGDVKEQMAQLKEQLGQLGEENKGIIRDAVLRAREEVQRAREEARRAADQVRTVTRNNGALERTTIDLNKAQIVFSDDKGELRVENKDGKKLLTAKDPQGKLLFSGPVESKEDMDKVPDEVRQRYQKLEQHELPALRPNDRRAQDDSEADQDNEDSDEEERPGSTGAFYEEVSGHLLCADLVWRELHRDA